MWLQVLHVAHDALHTRNTQERPHESDAVRTRVMVARDVQAVRFGNTLKTNSDMSVRDIDAHALLEDTAERTLATSATTLKLSPRSYHRTIKLARTIADLAGSECIAQEHILEALTYRPKGLFE
jgi:magnesium chelatase family protein